MIPLVAPAVSEDGSTVFVVFDNLVEPEAAPVREDTAEKSAVCRVFVRVSVVSRFLVLCTFILDSLFSSRSCVPSAQPV